MGKILGIDLGTTNSCMAVMDGTTFKIIPNAEGANTTPSVVAFTKTGERLVGQTAKRQAVTNPKNTIFSVKRFMGRKYSEVKDELSRVPYEVVEGKNGDAYIKAGDKSYSPPEISAMILQKLKTDAEAYLGERSRKPSSRFLHTSTIRRDRRPRTPEESPDLMSNASSTSRPPHLWHTVWTRRKTKPSRSTTSAAELSISPFSKSETACSR